MAETPAPPTKVCPTCGTRYDAEAAFCQLDGATLDGQPDSGDPYIGRTLLGQLRITSSLGAGGMGRVYRATRLDTGGEVAVKVLHEELTRRPDAVRRFQREARVATSLHHPNLVEVYLFGELPEGGLYLVMEYLDGRPLTDLIAAEGRFAPARALHLICQIAEGIAVAHQQGVVHRDVKPENVLIVRRGDDAEFVKVLDFGVARLLWDEQTVATQSGVIFGTARYISPEGASGEATDARSDVYSIAVLAYQLLTGRTPFESSSPVSLLMKHIHERPPSIRQMPGGHAVPDGVAALIHRCLDKNPEARMDDAGAFAAALRRAAHEGGLRLGPSATVPDSAPLAAALPSTHPSTKIPDSFAEAEPAPSLTAFGVRRTTPRLGRRALIAFFASLALVLAVGLGWAFHEEDPIPALAARAEAALAAGRFDEGDDSVAALTDEISRLAPDDPLAPTLRARAALGLRERAVTARASGDRDAARALYRRALVLTPNDPALQRALDSLEHVAETVHSLFVSETELSTGSPLRIEARCAPACPDAALPTALLERRGRVVRRVALERDEAGVVGASYRFRTPGTYVIRLEGGEFSNAEPAEVQVKRRRRSAPVTTSGAQRVPTPMAPAPMRTGTAPPPWSG